MTDANPAADEGFENETGRNAIEENLKSKPTWLRLLFMLVFAVIFYLAAIVGSFIVAIGFLVVLFTGNVNDRLRNAGQVVATYLYDIVRYLTYNSDTRPFPFDSDLRSDED